jgi:hypothetical protein
MHLNTYVYAMDVAATRACNSASTGMAQQLMS